MYDTEADNRLSYKFLTGIIGTINISMSTIDIITISMITTSMIITSLTKPHYQNIETLFCKCLKEVKKC